LKATVAAEQLLWSQVTKTRIVGLV